jgi:hypothetical protein
MCRRPAIALLKFISEFVQLNKVKPNPDFADSDFGQLRPDGCIEVVSVDTQVMAGLRYSHESWREG